MKTSFAKPAAVAAKPTVGAKPLGAKPTMAAKPIAASTKPAMAAKLSAAKPVSAAIPAKTIGKPIASQKIAKKAAPAPEPEPVETETETQQPVDENKAMVLQKKREVVSASPRDQIGSIQGQTTNSDYARPSLKMAQFIGPMTVDHGWTSGDLVLNNEYGLFRDDLGLEPVKLTIIEAKKQFVENLPYDGADGPMPQIFDTVEEVEAVAGAGATLWNGEEKPLYLPQLICGVLIERPTQIFNQAGEEIDCPMFDIEIDDRLFAAVMYRISGVAYSTAARQIFGWARGAKLHTFETQLSVKKETGKFTYYIPLVKRGANHDAEFVDVLVDKYFGG